MKKESFMCGKVVVLYTSTSVAPQCSLSLWGKCDFMRFIRLYLSFYKCLLCPLTIFFFARSWWILYVTQRSSYCILYLLLFHLYTRYTFAKFNRDKCRRKNKNERTPNAGEYNEIDFPFFLRSDLSLSLFHFMFFSFLLVPSNDSTFLCEPFFSYSSFNVYVAVMVFSRCCFFLFVKFGLHHQVKSENIGTGHFRFISQSSLLFLLFRSLRLFLRHFDFECAEYRSAISFVRFYSFFSRFSWMSPLDGCFLHCPPMCLSICDQHCWIQSH